MNALKSPVALAFPYIQWDTLSTTLKLTPQETALLRMAETNNMDYTLSDSRDASMYARVLLKLLSEATAAGAGTGRLAHLQSPNTGPDGTLTSLSSSSSSMVVLTSPLSEAEAMDLLNVDPLSVVSHYALSKLLDILDTLNQAATTASTSTKNVVTTASVFYVGKEGILVEQWKALLRILNKGGKGDMYAQKVASLCLAKLLIVACPSQQQRMMKSMTTSTEGVAAVTKPRPIQFASAIEPLEAITAWIVSQLKNTSGPYVAICTPALKVLMETTETRALFCQSGGIKYMARQLRIGTSQNKNKATTTIATTTNSGGVKKIGQASVQQLYEISFCLWILTYELNSSMAIRSDFAKDSSVIMALVDLVSVAPREKVVRVALSSLRNLATVTYPINNGTNDAATTKPQAATTPVVSNTTVVYDAKFFLSEMIACGLMKAIEHLRDRQFTDPDLVDDVNVLYKLLHDNYKEMSRYEVYKNEVESGHLQWGSTHKEAFFKENARLMEGPDGDFHIVKVLIALLSSNDEDVCAIACYDIGEFVRHYPNGRAIAKRLGAKELVMALIEHENIELQRQALQCISKIMVQNWEHVK
jgi:V-type H+-transporting ATPase subunit H